MKNFSGGVSLWPKPVLYPPTSKLDEVVFLHVRPCGFCNTGFPSFDITVASCKHIYHPFCLEEVFKSTDKCSVCGDMMHPDWWISWDIGPQSAKMQVHTANLKILELWKSMKESLQRVTLLGGNFGQWSSESSPPKLTGLGSSAMNDNSGVTRSLLGSSLGPTAGLSCTGGVLSFIITPPGSPRQLLNEAQSPFKFAEQILGASPNSPQNS